MTKNNEFQYHIVLSIISIHFQIISFILYFSVSNNKFISNIYGDYSWAYLASINLEEEKNKKIRK